MTTFVSIQDRGILHDQDGRSSQTHRSTLFLCPGFAFCSSKIRKPLVDPGRVKAAAKRRFPAALESAICPSSPRALSARFAPAAAEIGPRGTGWQGARRVARSALGGKGHAGWQGARRVARSALGGKERAGWQARAAMARDEAQWQRGDRPTASFARSPWPPTGPRLNRPSAPGDTRRRQSDPGLQLH